MNLTNIYFDHFDHFNGQWSLGSLMFKYILFSFTFCQNIFLSKLRPSIVKPSVILTIQQPVFEKRPHIELAKWDDDNLPSSDRYKWEKEGKARERERQTERDNEIQRGRETKIQRDREKERKRERKKELRIRQKNKKRENRKREREKRSDWQRSFNPVIG